MPTMTPPLDMQALTLPYDDNMQEFANKLESLQQSWDPKHFISIKEILLILFCSVFELFTQNQTQNTLQGHG